MQSPHIEFQIALSGSVPIGKEPLIMQAPRVFWPEDSAVRLTGKAHVSDTRGPSPTLGEVWESFRCRVARQVAQGERSGRTLADYRLAARDMLQVLGADVRIDSLRPNDFARLRETLARRLGKKTLANRINAIKTILRSASDLRDEDGRPRFSGTPDYGREFEPPSAAAIRRERQQKPSRAFTAEEIRLLLDAAREPLRTMVLLGINGGLGNTDVAKLRWQSVDLETGWIDYPRPKTAVDRRIPLWPETTSALSRFVGLFDPHSDWLVFRTSRGRAWVRTESDGRHVDALTKEFGKLRRRAGIAKQVGFYGLRHSFQTFGDESGDPQAVSAIMGHVDGSISGLYRERVSDERLIAVVETVRSTIFGG